jgi:hypothetical protein
MEPELKRNWLILLTSGSAFFAFITIRDIYRGKTLSGHGQYARTCLRKANPKKFWMEVSFTAFWAILCAGLAVWIALYS